MKDRFYVEMNPSDSLLETLTDIWYDYKKNHITEKQFNKKLDSSMKKAIEYLEENY